MACKFCEIGAGRYKNEIDRPIVESADYFAVSSIGGFVPGWTLVFPKEHKFNMSGDYRNPSLHEFLRKVTAVVSKEYGRCVHFEHGAAKMDSQTGCGVNHAHFHIVPFSKSIETLATVHQAEYGWKNVLAGDIENRCNGTEYLFCGDGLGAAELTGLLSILDNSESQFFRKLIASAIGLDSLYDYKKYRFEELSADTSIRLRNCFTSVNTTAA